MQAGAAAAAVEAAKPLAQLQEEFLQWRFGLFIHFGMATFHDRQWATGHEDPAIVAPTKLDQQFALWQRTAFRLRPDTSGGRDYGGHGRRYTNERSIEE